MTDKGVPNKKFSKTGKYLLLAACCILVIAGGYWLFLIQGKPPAKHPEPKPAKERIPIPPEKVIDYGKLKENSDKALTALMKERKAPYGIEQGVDMVVKPDESIKVGEKTVRMKKILDEVRLHLGEILESDLKGGAEQIDRNFGIYVVQPGDNIWNIHFRLLKDYYTHKGIAVSPMADEPDRHGHSSGVGKILKFSEHMVHIYNLKDSKLETSLHEIYPLTKIVIYNMDRIFTLLEEIDYKDVDRIEFDGETLWLPAER